METAMKASRICRIRIYHRCEVQIKKIHPRVTVWCIMRLCQVMPNSDPEGQIFYPHKTTMVDSFSCIPVSFDLQGLNLMQESPNVSCSYTFKSTILKFDVVCDVIMTSTPNALTTELCDLLYNQCIDNTCCYSFFIYPTGRIRVCKIRFVSTGENGGKACLVCKNISLHHWKFSKCWHDTRENEPCHEKTCLCHMQTTKTQISLRICAVWSGSLLFTA